MTKTEAIAKLVIGIALIVFSVAAQVLAVKYGSPQSVWFYCSILGWCQP